MATPRPKKFTAVKPFHVLGGGRYEAGDEVAGGDLAHVLEFGDAFVSSGREAPVVPPVADVAVAVAEPAADAG